MSVLCTVCGLGNNAYLRCQYAGCPDGRDLPQLRPADSARAEIARLNAALAAEQEARKRLEAALRGLVGLVLLVRCRSDCPAEIKAVLADQYRLDDALDALGGSDAQP
jgi:hypothetical protein